MIKIKPAKHSLTSRLTRIALSLATLAYSLNFLLTPQVAQASAPYLASDVLGQPGFTTNAQNNINPNASGFANFLSGLSLDPVSHHLYVVDTSNQRVLMFNLNSDNTLASSSASFVIGQPDFTSGNGDCNQGGDTSAAGLCNPQGIAVDYMSHHLYVSDSDNGRILIYNLNSDNTPVDANADFVIGQPDFTSSGGGHTATNFDESLNLTLDLTNHHLYLADASDNRILIWNLNSDNTPASQFNASADFVLGQTDFTSGSCNNGGISAATLCAPFDVTVDSTGHHLYVADSFNHRVLIYNLDSSNTPTSNGQAASAVLGQSDFTSRDCNQNGSVTADTLCYPFGPTIDPISHQLYVSDTGNSRALVYNLDGSNLPSDGTADAVLGQTDFISDGPTGPSATSLNPYIGLAIDPTNHRLFADDGGGNRVLIYNLNSGDTPTSNGASANAVLGQPDFTSNFYQGLAVPNATGLDYPTGSAIDTIHHRLFVSDINNSRVLVYNLDSNNNLIDHTADNVIGQPDFNTSDCNTTQNGLCYQSGLAYDSVHDRLFVSDTGNGRVMVFDTSAITNGMNADSELGEPDFNSTDNHCNNVNQNSFCNTSSLAYDPNADRLFVVDISWTRVMVFDTTTITNEKNADNVIGQPDFNSSNCNTYTLQDSLCDPIGLAYDSINHRLFVSDFDNNRVVVFDGNNIHDGMNANNVIGQPDFNNNGCGAGQDSLCGIEGLGYDPVNNRLFVEDSNNNRVMVFSTSTVTDGMNATAVIGQPDFDTYNGCDSVSQSSLCIRIPCDAAGDLAYDPTNNRLYIADSFNHRIMIFDFVHLSNIPNGTVGAPYSQTISVSEGQGTVSPLSVIVGSLPPGLSLDTGTGILSGTPTTAGSSPFSIAVTDDNGAIGSFSDMKDYNVVIAAAPPAPPSGGTSGSTGSTGGTGASTGTSESPTTTTISLNSLTDYFTSIGHEATVAVGDVFSFCVTLLTTCDSSNTHTVTVTSIDEAAGTVTLTFASTPQVVTLATGETKSVDVTSDNTPDIAATLISITSGKALLNFRSLVIPPTNATPSTNPVPVTSKATSTRHIPWVWLVGGAALIALVLVGLILVRRRRGKGTSLMPGPTIEPSIEEPASAPARPGTIPATGYGEITDQDIRPTQPDRPDQQTDDGPDQRVR